MAPGTWNGVTYTAGDIKQAYESTDWNNKDVVSLIADHEDKPLRINDWLGWVKKPRIEGDNLIGDLELYDEDIVVKLALAKAKFGISPRVKGMENPDNHEFKNFMFENFSVVTNPAVKKAYINLSSMKGGKMTEKILQEETTNELEDPVETEEESEEETEEENSESLEEESTEELQKKKYPYEKLRKKKYPYPKEEACKKKKYPEEEMSDEELLEITTNSEWTNFVGKMKKKYPKMPLSAIAKAFKTKSQTDAELEELSEEELIGKIEKLTSILRRKKKYPEEEEDMAEKKIKELSEKIAEIDKRLNEPDSKTAQTRELSQSHLDTSITGIKQSPGVTEMANLLRRFV